MNSQGLTSSLLAIGLTFKYTTIMENIILNNCYKYNPHYVHALEVDGVWDLDNIVSSICIEYYELPAQEIKDFFNSMSIYYLGEDTTEEVQVYNYNFDEAVENFK